jgi:cytochrome c oxidase subunit III
MPDLLTTKHRNTGTPPEPPGGSGGGEPGRPGASRRISFAGLVVMLAAIAVFFGAFAAAFLARRSLPGDWVSIPLPRMTWWNTGVLIASSLLLELARRGLRAGKRIWFNRFWTAGTALGALFLAGQYLVWRQLQDAGIYLSSNPSSSFFYVLSVAHALHLLGGLVALLYINAQALSFQLGPGKRTAAEVSTFYWHFMDALWLFLLLLFSYWG